MDNKLIAYLLLILPSTLFAANFIELYQAPITSLSKFILIDTAPRASSNPDINSLQVLNLTQMNNNKITRYQQFYKGIPVIGAQVTLERNRQASLQANGRLVEDIQLDIKPAISSQQALELAKKSYFKQKPQSATGAETSQLQIRFAKKGELLLTYLLSFKGTKTNGDAIWPFFILDAQTGAIIKQWNNIQTYLESGPGGNERVHEYWYGKDNLPALDLQQTGTNCVMESTRVKLVNLQSSWDWAGRYLTPHHYLCGKNSEENINGAFSPTNDAYYFGHTIVEMYKNWYELNALQYRNGKPMQLIMRVHFGKKYDNAFWDGKTMNFGDGYDFYPLVSLDIAAHEVTHGFTEQHANLEYHDQSGAINESISDMAGLAARAYLLETSPNLYNKAYLVPDKLTWGIGETIMHGQSDLALRYLDNPSKDGHSADCVDKQLAKSNETSCAINLQELVDYANQHIKDPFDRQGYIVHTASGIFNKAFYLLSQKIGVKKAYNAMSLANIKYWTPNTGFKTGACGVVHAAKDLDIGLDQVHSSFGQVGIETNNC